MKKTLASSFLTLALLLSTLGAACASFSLRLKSVRADDSSDVLPGEAADPIDGEELAATVTSSAITDSSQTFKVSLSASTTLYNNGRYNNVFVKLLDSSFDADTVTQAADEAIEKVKNGEAETYEPAVFDAHVFKISYTKAGGNKTPEHIVIPEYINVADTTLVYPDGTSKKTCCYRFHVIGVEPEVVFSKNSTREIDWTGIESITLPSSIETIAPNAFVGAEEAGAAIYCADALEEASEKDWAEDWTDTDNVFYGRTFDEETPYAELNDLYKTPSNTNQQTLGKGSNYLLCCYLEDMVEYNFSFVLEYKLKGSSQAIYERLPLFNENPGAYYDGIGSTIGRTDLSLSIDIPLEKGQEVDPESLVFHNIRLAERRTDGKAGFLPVLGEPSYKLIPHIAYSEPVYLSDIISSFEPTSISHFFDYTDIKIRFNLTEGLYEKLKPSAYNANKADIENGTLQIRVQFDSLSNTDIHVGFLDAAGDLVNFYVPITTPIPTTTIEDGAEYGFMIQNSTVDKDFSANSLQFMELVGFTIHIDLFNMKKNSISNNSKFDVRFANVVLVDNGNEVSKTSVPMIMLIAILVYVVAFAVIAVLFYFYRKTRFKNDEFRRVNTKKYIFAALKNFVGFLIVLMAILCILGRWAWLNNTLVVFNPIDVGVIVFTIVGAIFIGFTIRNLFLAFKQARERKKKERLHLDQDVVEDGTN